MTFERVLCRIPDLRISLNVRNEVIVDRNGRKSTLGPHALRLLEAFVLPKPVSEVLDSLKPGLSETQDWVQALRTIQQMEEIGVLVDSSHLESAAPFDQAAMHIAMLEDRGRTNAFIGAIKHTVPAGAVVADIGTGTGVLAAAAAHAGSKTVYAIEAGAVRQIAEALFQHNRLSDTVKLVPGWSTQISLPEPVDVIIGELLGNDPFGEDILEIFRDAVRRFLKPGGKVLPEQVELWGVLVQLPSDVTGKHRFEASMLERWDEDYGISFSSLPAENHAAVFTVPSQTARDWKVLSAPFSVSRADLLSGEEVLSEQRFDVTTLADGQLNGVLFYFTARLCEGVSISTRPQDAGDDGHWRNVVRLFAVDMEVSKGQQVRVDCSEGYRKATLQIRP